MEVLDEEVPPTKKTEKAVPKLTKDEFLDWVGMLNKAQKPCGILRLVEPFSDQFVSNNNNGEISEAAKKLQLQLLFHEDNLPLTREELVHLGESRRQELSISKEVALEIELVTKLQSKNQNWFKFRSGRITASKFKAACHTKSFTSAPSLISAICYPEKLRIKTKATEWGCCHEKHAQAAYIKEVQSMHVNLQFEECGLILNEKYPFFGATPDGLVTCNCCGFGCIEIKCPYCAKETSVEEGASRISCFSQNDSGKWRLITTHAYYYQVQAQLFITNAKFCDFIVWTTVGKPHIERIVPNSIFWNEIAPKAETFFNEAIMPELLGKFFTRKNETIALPEVSSDNEEKWCIAKMGMEK